MHSKLRQSRIILPAAFPKVAKNRKIKIEYLEISDLKIVLTSRFSILHFMSRARVKNASSTLMEAFADVSINFMPYSMANSSPRSLDT